MLNGARVMNNLVLTLSNPPHCITLPLHCCRYRLAFGTSDKLQTASLVAAYHAVRIHAKQLAPAGS